jgi:hypothetical protein
MGFIEGEARTQVTLFRGTLFPVTLGRIHSRGSFLRVIRRFRRATGDAGVGICTGGWPTFTFFVKVGATTPAATAFLSPHE